MPSNRSFSALADFKEKAQSLKRRVKSAMVYHRSWSSFVACVIVGFILYFIIPKFEAIFKDFGVPLPKMTTFLIEASHFLIKYFYIVFLTPLFCALDLHRSCYTGIEPGLTCATGSC